MSEHRHGLREHRHGPSAHVGGSAHGVGRRLALACAITALVLVLEIAGGLLTHSLALLSDAGHVFGDLFALTLSAYALKLAQTPPDRIRTFGYHRAEVFAALLNGVCLFAIAIGIVIEAWHRLTAPAPTPVDAGVMSGVAVIGLLANLGIFFLLRSAAAENLNIRSATAHVIGDLLASVAVVGGGLAMWATGNYLLDPILSLGVVVLILRSAAGILGESLHILLEGIPRGLELGQVERAIHDVRGVRGVHDLHIWSLCSDYCALSAHVLVAEQTTREARQIVDEVAHMLEERFRIVHTTLQAESEACADACEPDGDGRALCAHEPGH